MKENIAALIIFLVSVSVFNVLILFIYYTLLKERKYVGRLAGVFFLNVFAAPFAVFAIFEIIDIMIKKMNKI